MNKNNTTKKGFSIGEVMIAMFILLFGIIGAVFLSARSTAQIGDSRNAIIAASLAQEGVELVRNVRDNSVTQETCDIASGGAGTERCTAFEAYVTPNDNNTSYGWPSYGSANGSDGRRCSIDYTIEGTLGKLNCQNPETILYFNSDVGFYTHLQGGNQDDDLKFNRTVFINYYDIDPTTAVTNIADEDVAAKITSVVTWSQDADRDATLTNAEGVEKNCKIGKQCAYAQTMLTSWINYGE